MTKQQKQTIQNAINKCRFPVFWDDTNKQRYISIPEGMENEASEDMFLNYLVKEFGFNKQSCIPGAFKIKPILEVEFKNRIIPELNNLTGTVSLIYGKTFTDGFTVFKFVKKIDDIYLFANEDGKEWGTKEKDILRALKFNWVEKI